MKTFVLLCTLLVLIQARSLMDPIFVNGKFHDLISPLDVNTTVDCTVRTDAYAYAKKLLPERGELLSVYRALQLDTCGVPVPAEDAPILVPEDKLKPEGYTLYVDQKVGKDSYDGSFEQPFATIQAAVYKSRTVQGKKVIFIREGEYVFEEKLVLTPVDSELTITSYNNEKVIISGSRIIDVEWKPYKVNQFEVHENINYLWPVSEAHPFKSGEEIEGRIKYYGKSETYEECQDMCNKDEKCLSYTWHNEKCPEWSNMCYGIYSIENTARRDDNHVSGSKVNIYVTDLSKENIDTFDNLFINGERQVRARYPNGNNEIYGLHTDIPNFLRSDVLSWDCCMHFGQPYEYHVSDPHFDNTTYNNYHMAFGGVGKQWNPPLSYWALKHPVGGGAFTYNIAKGVTAHDTYFSPKEWKNPIGAFFHGFHWGYWGFWMFEIDDYQYNTETKDRYLHWSKGGFQEARGGSTGQEFFIENVFEELDAPTEWFYDKVTKQLYFYPNGTIDNFKQIRVPRTQRLIELRGSASYPIHDVHIQGISFQNTDVTFMEPHEVPSGGDIAIHRGGVIFVEGAERIFVEYNSFIHNGGTSVFFSNYVKDSQINRNEMYLGGDSGILFIGNSDLIDGTGHNHPTDNLVSYNLIHETGVFQKQSSPFMQSKTAYTTIEGNVFFNIPRAGINFNDAFSGGHQVHHNLIFNAVRETTDHGCINTWDRMPFSTVKKDGSVSITPDVTYTTENFFIGNYHSIWPLDHDDGSCYYEDSDNILVYGGFKNYLGHSKKATRNVYIYPDAKKADWDVPTSYTYARNNLKKIGWDSEPHCLNNYGSVLNKSGWNHVWTENICIMKTPEVYHFDNCGKDNYEKMQPFTDHNEIYSPLGREGSVISCSGNKWTFDDLAELGMDKNTNFHPAPDHFMIDKMIREKLHM
ncbi:hypothetical protein WA158_007552 [Blastocystis sp. Blastoise]